MADILLDEESFPATPANGQAVFFADSTASLPAAINDAGRGFVMGGQTRNASIATQSPAAATDVYYTDSDLLIPSFGLQVRTNFLWTVSASKNANGVAAPVYVIRIGAGKAITDAAILTLTGPAQTAVADIGTLYIMATMRSIGGAGVMQGTAWWVHRGTAANTTTSGTGFANDSTGHVEGTSAGFNTALAGQFVGISINGGTAAAWVVTQVVAQASW
jgi:hypothetical protein